MEFLCSCISFGLADPPIAPKTAAVVPFEPYKPPLKIEMPSSVFVDAEYDGVSDMLGDPPTSPTIPNTSLPSSPAFSWPSPTEYTDDIASDTVVTIPQVVFVQHAVRVGRQRVQSAEREEDEYSLNIQPPLLKRRTNITKRVAAADDDGDVDNNNNMKVADSAKKRLKKHRPPPPDCPAPPQCSPVGEYNEFQQFRGTLQQRLREEYKAEEEAFMAALVEARIPMWAIRSSARCGVADTAIYVATFFAGVLEMHDFQGLALELDTIEFYESFMLRRELLEKAVDAALELYHATYLMFYFVRSGGEHATLYALDALEARKAGYKAAAKSRLLEELCGGDPPADARDDCFRFQSAKLSEVYLALCKLSKRLLRIFPRNLRAFVLSKQFETMRQYRLVCMTACMETAYFTMWALEAFLLRNEFRFPEYDHELYLGSSGL